MKASTGLCRVCGRHKKFIETPSEEKPGWMRVHDICKECSQKKRNTQTEVEE